MLSFQGPLQCMLARGKHGCLLSVEHTECDPPPNCSVGSLSRGLSQRVVCSTQPSSFLHNCWRASCPGGRARKWEPQAYYGEKRWEWNRAAARTGHEMLLEHLILHPLAPPLPTTGGEIRTPSVCHSRSHNHKTQFRPNTLQAPGAPRWPLVSGISDT